MLTRTRAGILACGMAAALLPPGMLLPCAAHDRVAPLFRLFLAASSPEALIRRLLEESRDAEFQGIQETTVYRPQRQSSRQKVLQKGGRRQVIYLSPPKMRGKQIYVDGSRMPEMGLEGDLDGLLMKHLGKATVAGRSTHVVEVRPPGRAAGTRKIWIDCEKWVPLCWEERDPTGKLLSRTAYTSIRFDSSVPRIVPPPAFTQPPSVLPLPMSLAEAEKVAGFTVHSPGYLPKGFHREAVTVVTIVGGKRPAYGISVMFSNGLDLVTFSQAPADLISGQKGPGKPRVSAYGQWVWVKGDFHYTLSATPALPEDEVKRIIESVD